MSLTPVFSEDNPPGNNSSEDLQLEIFTDEQHGFTITYSHDFESVEVPSHEVVLALRNREDSYPTFNIVAQPGYYPVESRPFADQQREVLRSYRQAGMVDAVLRDSGAGTISGRPALEATIQYTDNREKITYVAWLGLVSASDRHFFLTLVDKVENYEESQQTFKNFIDAFFLHEEPDAFIQKEIQAGRNNRYLVLGITFLLVLGLIVILIRKRGLDNQENSGTQ